MTGSSQPEDKGRSEFAFRPRFFSSELAHGPMRT